MYFTYFEFVAISSESIRYDAAEDHTVSTNLEEVTPNGSTQHRALMLNRMAVCLYLLMSLHV